MASELPSTRQKQGRPPGCAQGQAHTRRRSLLRRRRCGATTVEFALVAPILFLFFFAALEFTRANMIRNTAENAAYEGAREAILVGGTPERAVNRTNEMLGVIGVFNAEVSVTPETITSNTKEVTIDITIPLNSNGYGVSRFFSGANLTVSSTYQRESTSTTD